MSLDFSTRELPGVNQGISENTSAGELRGHRFLQLHQELHRKEQPLRVTSCSWRCWGLPHITQTSLHRDRAKCRGGKLGLLDTGWESLGFPVSQTHNGAGKHCRTAQLPSLKGNQRRTATDTAEARPPAGLKANGNLH